MPTIHLLCLILSYIKHHMDIYILDYSCLKDISIKKNILIKAKYINLIIDSLLIIEITLFLIFSILSLIGIWNDGLIFYIIWNLFWISRGCKPIKRILPYIHYIENYLTDFKILWKNPKNNINHKKAYVHIGNNSFLSIIIFSIKYKYHFIIDSYYYHIPIFFEFLLHIGCVQKQNLPIHKSLSIAYKNHNLKEIYNILFKNYDEMCLVYYQNNTIFISDTIKIGNNYNLFLEKFDNLMSVL